MTAYTKLKPPVLLRLCQKSVKKQKFVHCDQFLLSKNKKDTDPKNTDQLQGPCDLIIGLFQQAILICPQITETFEFVPNFYESNLSSLRFWQYFVAKIA